MRARLLAPFLALAALVAGPAQAASHNNQQIGNIQVDGRTCLFFYLQNVPQADPVVPGAPWFAIPVGHANYQTFASTLLSAKVARQSVSVQTDGSMSCGYATAYVVSLS